MEFPTQAEKCLEEWEAMTNNESLPKFAVRKYEAFVTRFATTRWFFFPDDSRITSSERGCTFRVAAHLP